MTRGLHRALLGLVEQNPLERPDGVPTTSYRFRTPRHQELTASGEGRLTITSGVAFGGWCELCRRTVRRVRYTPDPDHLSSLSFLCYGCKRWEGSIPPGERKKEGGAHESL